MLKTTKTVSVIAALMLAAAAVPAAAGDYKVGSQDKVTWSGLQGDPDRIAAIFDAERQRDSSSISD